MEEKGSEAEGEHAPEGEGEDADVEPQGEIVDIFKVGFHAVGHVFNLGCGASESADLSISCKAGTHLVTTHVIWNPFRIIACVFEHVGPGSDERHVALEDIEQLRQFVERGFAHNPADGGYPGIVVGCLNGIGLVVDIHRAELEHVESPPLVTGSLLAEKHPSGRAEGNP